MTGNEYLQFITKKFSHFITTPIEKSEIQRVDSFEKRSLRKKDWFGNVPFYVRSVLQKRK